MRRIFLILLLFLCGGFFFFPSIVDAEQTCGCYCKSSSGAVLISSSVASSAACKETCEESELNYLGCFTEEQSDSLPEKNRMCWTESSCTSDEVPTELDENGNVVTSESSVWGGQEPSCPSGKGYCYNPLGAVSEFGGGVKTDLGVSIGSLTETADLSEYIEAVYTFLLPAASLLAIVILMVGGLQYMLARGNTGQIEKAKSRMGQAILGLVLLMGAYSIAYLIDPRLTSFSALRVPKIQTVLYIDEDSSCETLNSIDGVTVTPINATAEQVCGQQGFITSLSETVGLPDGFELGSKCFYETCSNSVEKCVSISGSDDSFTCVRCSEASAYTEATPALCSRLKHSATADEAAKGEKFYCEHDKFAADECVEFIYPTSPANDSLDCKKLQKYIEETEASGCRGYDLAGALTVGGYVTDLDEFFGQQETSSQAVAGFDNYLQVICEEDPCGLAPDGGACGLNGSSLVRVDCIVVGDTIPLAETSYQAKTCTGTDGNAAWCMPSW